MLHQFVKVLKKMTFSLLVEKFSNLKKEMRFFDVNCWIGEDPFPSFKHFKDSSELIIEMDKYGIEEVLVSHFLAWKYNPFIGNDILADQIRESEKCYGCYVLVPFGTEKIGDIEVYIDRMVESKKARAFRIFPLDHHFSIADWSMRKVFSALHDCRIPLIFPLSQITWAFNQVHWDVIYELSQSYKKLPIIVDGYGPQELTQSRFFLPLLENCENVYLDIHNLLLYGIIEEIVNRIGAHRLLFSTGMPFNNPGASLMRIITAQISNGEKKQIAQGNIKRLLKQIRI